MKMMKIVCRSHRAPKFENSTIEAGQFGTIMPQRSTLYEFFSFSLHVVSSGHFEKTLILLTIIKNY